MSSEQEDTIREERHQRLSISFAAQHQRLYRSTPPS
jgi:hypothetical protein